MARGTWLALVAVALVAPLAACSSDDAAPATPSTSGPTTGAPGGPVAALVPYTKDGPAAAGTITLALGDGRRVQVWYPADKPSVAATPKETFDVASLLSPELQAKVPSDLRVQYEIPAYVGAEPAADGPYPVVLFSHGFAGFPEQSADLVTHLAEWGFVVAAPDHVERSLSGILGIAAKGVPKRSDPEVLSATLDLIGAEAKRPASPLSGLVDLDHVAVIGHSAGAGAAYEMAGTDPRIDAFISYSVGLGATDPAPAVPDVPGMVMLGTRDGIIPPAASRAVYAGMKAPKYLVEIGGGGHLVFSDICLMGRDNGGIVAIGKEAGLPVEQFEKLGTDGCKAPSPPPEDAFGAIDDLSVDFLRTELGMQDELTGLADPAIAKAFTTVDIVVKADS